MVVDSKKFPKNSPNKGLTSEMQMFKQVDQKYHKKYQKQKKNTIWKSKKIVFGRFYTKLKKPTTTNQA